MPRVLHCISENKAGASYFVSSVNSDPVYDLQYFIRDLEGWEGSQVGFFLFVKFSKGLKTLMLRDTKGVVTIYN